MFKTSFGRHLVYLYVAVLLLLCISLLMLPLWCDLLLWLFILLVFKWDIRQVSVFMVMIVVVLSALQIFSPYVITPEIEQRVFYREYEKYIGETSYTPNVNDVIHMNYGDIYVIDGGKDMRRELVKEKRDQIFITDKYGFRNDRSSIEEADILLIGDSYVAGSTTSQPDIPSNVLADITGKKVATLSYPSGPTEYEKIYMSEYKDKFRDDAKIFIFYFEGNDFYVWNKKSAKSKRKPINWASEYIQLEQYKDKLLGFIYGKYSLLYKKIRGTSHAMNKLIFIPSMNSYYKTGDKMMGYLKPYNRAAEMDYAIAPVISTEELRSKITAVVFIPTKYRVYSDILGKTLKPSPSRDFIKREYKKLEVPVIDLTPALARRAQELLPKGQYVYWRDDTHWGPHGIRAAMECLDEWMNMPKDKQTDYNCNQAVMASQTTGK
jgi:hypothetical protein